MKTDDEFITRKQIRLENYDYSSNGAYFVTVCTKDRQRILSDITVGAIHESPAVKLTKYGEITIGALAKTENRFDNATITDYVIMPDHIHIVLVLLDKKRAIRESPLQKRSELSKIIGFFKTSVSKEIHKMNPDLDVWQRGYFEHIIRNENDLYEIRKYIENNPKKWVLEDK